MKPNQVIITQTEFNKLKNEVKNNSDKEIIFTSENDDLNRKVLEKLPINILLINQSHRKDFQKQRNSGFNHVLAKIAKKNNIMIGINLDEIINSKAKQKAIILARINQNIRLCNKNKVKMKFIESKNKRDIHDLKALGLVLGMPTWMMSLLKNDKNENQ